MLTFAFSRSRAIVSSTPTYASVKLRASARSLVSSPSTSNVASFESAFCSRTTRTASSSSAPAMYRDESWRTTGRGTAGSSWTIARSSRATSRGLALAHEALACGTDERHRLGEEHAHRVAQCDGLLVGASGHVQLSHRRRRQLDCGVQRQRRELLPLRLLNRLRLLLRELAQAAQQILRIAAEREPAEAAFHADQPRRARPCSASRRRARARPRHRPHPPSQ